MIKQTLFAALAFAALGAAPVAAQAQDAVPTVKVPVAGIDINSAAGARILLRRITTAAQQVCGGAPRSTLDRQVTFRPCVEAATKRAVRGLRLPADTQTIASGADAGQAQQSITFRHERRLGVVGIPELDRPFGRVAAATALE